MTMPRTWKSWAVVLLVLAAVVFAIRVSGPDDLEDNSQSRNVGYAIDLVERGNWLVQHDLQDRILSKPPLHTWLIGVLAKPFGLNRLTLTLPSFVAVVAILFLVLGIGSKRFGLRAGGLAGFAVIMTPLIWRQSGMVRSDALFTLAITGGAWAAFRAWESGRGWTLFWVCAAVATLTKGPLGILLSAAGLLAWFWERRSHGPLPRPAGGHVRGLILFVLICLVWIAPALWFHGRELIDKMIFEELLGHVTSADNGKVEASLVMRFLKPTIHFMSRFAPFSLFACYGIYRVIRFPSAEASERRFERFLTCWVLSGMVIFTIAAHQRADLLLPLWPAGALLAGREISRLGGKMGSRKLAWSMAIVCVPMLIGEWCNYHPVGGKAPKSSRYSRTVREAATAFRATGIDPSSVRNLGAPTTFQYYLGTAEIKTTSASIVARRDVSKPTWVATNGESLDPAALAGANILEVFRWPIEVSEKPVVKVYEITWSDRRDF